MNISPEIIQTILSGGGADQQMEAAKRQQAMVDQLRRRSMTPPQQQMAGRIVAPNFGEAIGGALAGYQANKMQPGVDAQYRSASDASTNARKQYLDTLMMGLRKNYPQQPGSMLPPDGMEDR